MKHGQSFATWLKMRDDQSDGSGSSPAGFPDVELHFNFWYAYSSGRNREESEPVLDIGVLLSDFTHVESLNIYFPFKVTNTDVSDLGKLLRDDVTLNAVFNDNHRIKSTSGGKSFLVSCEKPSKNGNGKGNDDFHIYKLDPCQDLKIEQKRYDSGEGTIVSIPVAELGISRPRMKIARSATFVFA